MTFRHPKLRQPIQVTKGGVLIAALAVGFALVAVIGSMVALVIGVSNVARDNQKAIAELKDQNARLTRIEKPSQQDLTNAALRALRAIRSCARSPSCRRQNPGVRQLARAIPRGEIPRRAPRRRSGSSSGGGSSGSTGGSNRTPAPRPSPPAPSQTGSSPQPTTRPAPSSPPPSSTPARPPAAAPPAQTPPAPSPRPGVTVTPPQAPPVTVNPPPLPVPVPLPGVCTPVIGVNCPPNR